jgi:hemerythrin-like domain-containing protein
MLINPDAPADKPETDQMKVVHRVMRRELPLLADLIAAVRPGDNGRSAVLAHHLKLVLDMIHEHHESEDELIWPLLHARVPLRDELIEVMESQHAAVAEALDGIRRELPAWSAGASAEIRDRLAGHLRALATILITHLDLEEREVLPLIHDYLTVAEWLAPQRHAMKHGPKALIDKLLLAGMVLEDTSSGERAWFLSEMPPPARAMWKLIGRRRYAGHVARVRAAAAPAR